MKKAKSKATKPKALPENHLALELMDEKKVNALSEAAKNRYYGLTGSIRQLMAVHNALIDASKTLTEWNQACARRAINSLSFDIDQKIEHFNKVYENELRHEKSKKPNKKTLKKNVFKRGA